MLNFLCAELASISYYFKVINTLKRIPTQQKHIGAKHTCDRFFFVRTSKDTKPFSHTQKF